MTQLNRNLMIAAAILLVVSVLTYRQSVTRADRFQRGQIFLANLNPDEIAKIHIVQGEDEVTLQRQTNGFLVMENEGYPASNASVNRLLRSLMGVGLEREIGSGADLAAELELEPTTAETIEVGLQDAADKEMVRIRVGKALEDGPGRYVQRLDGDSSSIYLSSGSVSLSADAGGYLEKEILNREQSEVARIEGQDFELVRAEGETQLVLAGASDSVNLKTSEINRLKGLVSGLRFDEVYL
jgi:hypothetical protein